MFFEKLLAMSFDKNIDLEWRNENLSLQLWQKGYKKSLSTCMIRGGENYCIPHISCKYIYIWFKFADTVFQKWIFQESKGYLWKGLLTEYKPFMDMESCQS